MNLSLERVKANRNFANKIWNTARYVIGKLDSLPTETAASQPTLPDRWILARLDHTIADCTRLVEKHQYGQAGSAAYEFIWSEYADWYLEVSKQQLKQPQTALTTARTLVSVLDATLRLLHPYVPFVTEEIWQHLKAAAGERFAPDDGWPEALIVAPWPEVEATPPRDDDIADFTHLMDIVRAIRNARSENGVDARRRIAATIIAGESAAMLTEQREALAALAQLAPQQLEISAARAEKPAAAIALVVSSSEIYLSLAGMVDPAAERARLEKEIAALQAQIKRLQDLLGSPFAEKAPSPVVQKEHDKLADYRASQEKLEKRLTGLD
jgi:valyl-tRNA synthetase